MQKILTLTVTLFLVLLSGIVITSAHNTSIAKKSDISSTKKMHYEATLNKSKFVDQKGNKFDSKTLKDGLVIINFWASWRTPCLEEFPSIVSLSNKIDNPRFKILAISSDDVDVKKNIKKVVKKFGIKFPIIEDAEGTLTDNFMISALPVSLIFYNGKLIEESQGAKDFDSQEFIETVKKYLKK